MNIKEKIRPITFLKTNAADVMAAVTKTHSPVIITHNGEAKMVVQDIESYNDLKESLSMLKLAAMGREQVDKGRTRSADEVFESLEKKLGI
ncbi:MAG: type II toxin-antitoxin system Phd/YefM family antitoxin [Candidatus Aminicenantes bacterium]|nr:type II toxin-antitoxin system Phd/YefM family antitoxin [Candidatus Aminicenantes bacterium]